MTILEALTAACKDINHVNLVLETRGKREIGRIVAALCAGYELGDDPERIENFEKCCPPPRNNVEPEPMNYPPKRRGKKAKAAEHVIECGASENEQ